MNQLDEILIGMLPRRVVGRSTFGALKMAPKKERLSETIVTRRRSACYNLIERDMKDYSKITWAAAIMLLFFVLSSFDVSLVLGSYQLHLGWIHRLLPFMVIAFAIWLFRRGGCCCLGGCSAKAENNSEDVSGGVA